MKKSIIHTNILILYIFIFFSKISFGQLSGTYTIGGTSPNYSSISQAVSSLNSQGISNSVIFNIRPGTYSGQITINAIAGTSATKTVTFQAENGDSTSVIITHTSSTSSTNNFTLKLNNSDYIIFKKVTIERSGSNSYSQVLDISGGATHNKFESCIIKGYSGTSTATYSALIGSTNSADDSYNQFIFNLFDGGSYGMYYLGRGSTMLDEGLVIKNNIFKNQYYRAMYIASQSSPEITGNQIDATSASSSYQGIYAFYCDDGLRIIKNKININNGGIGLNIHNSSGSATNKGLIANNFISIGGAVESYGIYINLSSAQHIYYNNINMYSSNAASKILYLNGATTATLDIRNNNFYSSGNAYSIYVSNTTVTPVSTCNYNNLYTAGTYIGFWQNTGDITDFNTWVSVTGFDINSVSCDPMYVSTTDLHTKSGIINNAGTSSLSSITPVNDDIDNQLRSTSTPDIGADEFSIEDIGVCYIEDIDTICENSSVEVKIYIKNYASSIFSGICPVYYQYNSNPANNETTTITNLQAGDSVIFSFNNNFIASPSGNNTLKAGTSLSTDINTSNDESSEIIVYVKDLPFANAGNDTSFCVGDTVLLTASGGSIYAWNTGATSNQIYVSPLDTTVFYVTVKDDYGCSSLDSVTLTPYNFNPVTSNASFIVNGLYVTLINNSINATNYLWIFGDGNSDTSHTPPIHFYSDSGSYDVTLYAYNQCYIDSSTYPITVSGINKNENITYFKLYPNPANEFFYINSNSLKNKDIEINIKTIEGTELKKIKFKNPMFNQKIDISDLAKGIYFIEIISNNNIERQTLIKID